MHNFDDLQRRCKKYRVKKVLKYILVILTLLLATALYLFSPLETKPSLQAGTTPADNVIKKISQEKVKKKETVKKTVATQTKIPQKKSNKVKTIKKTYSLQFLVAQRKYMAQIKKKKRYLESLGFKECKPVQSAIYIHLICNESNSLEALHDYIELAKRNNLEYVIRTQSYKTTDQKVATPKKEKQEKQQTKQKKASISMLKVQNRSMEQLQTKFAQTPNYNIAIIIARNYYKKGAFQKAISWAKKANEVDKSDAESWIIYAKSLYALGQDEKARQLLHIYLQYENSEEVDKLLQNWERN